ncbi:MAG: class I SAM-dependent methyltransferase [Bacteriovoracia bacterium]
MDTMLEKRALAELDDPSRALELRQKIQSKPFLKRFYEEVYDRYKRCIDQTTDGGIVLELGSGAGFAKSCIPEIITTDVLSYDGIDKVVDATKMPFQDESVRSIVMMNVFHHIPDVEAFLKEAQRVLKKGGRIFILDQNLGWISKPILKYAHHEPFNDQVEDWKFETTGPLSGANGALAWVVFFRDELKFKQKFPMLSVTKKLPHSPFRYWVSGGLKDWTLAPGFLFGFWTFVDRALCRLSPKFGSFIDIEIVKQ